MTLNTLIGIRLKEARTKYNRHGKQTLKEVSDSKDVPLPLATISAMENGKSMTPQNIRDLAEHYGVSLDYLFGIEGAVPNPDTDIQTLCRKTGLSMEAINTLSLWALTGGVDVMPDPFPAASQGKTSLQYTDFGQNMPDRIISAKGFGRFIEAFLNLQLLNDQINKRVDLVWDCIRTGKDLRECDLDNSEIERDRDIAMYKLWESLRNLANEIIPIETTTKENVQRCIDSLIAANAREGED